MLIVFRQIEFLKSTAVCLILAYYAVNIKRSMNLIIIISLSMSNWMLKINGRPVLCRYLHSKSDLTLFIRVNSILSVSISTVHWQIQQTMSLHLVELLRNLAKQSVRMNIILHFAHVIYTFWWIMLCNTKSVFFLERKRERDNIMRQFFGQMIL